MYKQQIAIAPFITFISVLTSDDNEQKSAFVERKQDCPAGLNAFKVMDSFFDG